jgi:hypothetical protein
MRTQVKTSTRKLQYTEDSQAPICLVDISADFSQLVINKMPLQSVLICAKRKSKSISPASGSGE